MIGRSAAILHLYANYKWTGPADPAIRCAAGLRELGEDVLFAQANWTAPGAEHRMQKELLASRMPVIGGLDLRRHFQPFSLRRDVRRLTRRLRRGEFRLLHCHQRADHLLAVLARRRAERRVVVVRSLYDPEAPPRRWREWISFGNTDGVIAPTARCASAMIDRFGFPADRVLLQEPPVDHGRFTQQTDLRREFGFTDEHVVIGITARVQPQRRFDLLWNVARRVTHACPHVRFVLLGRGNEHDMRELVHEPIRRLGLNKHVVLPGYLYEPRYTRALASLQVFMFLVPGSDGTCRAVREAMAAGLPIAATRRGILPELIGERADGPAPDACGLLLDEDVEPFAEGLIDLSRRSELRRTYGDAARRRVVQTMDQTVASHRLLEFYRQLDGG